jgi:DNA-binding beta-propeller fold protein YncE
MTAPALLLAVVVAAGPAGGSMRHERAFRSVVELRPALVIGGGYYSGAFTSVAGVHCDRRSGEIFVVDSTMNQIEIFDARGAPLFSFTDDEHLKGPLRVAVDAEDRIHVLDGERSRIKVFSYRGEFQGYLEPPGLEGAEKPLLTAIAFDEDGDLWVGDSRSGQVVAYGRGLQPKQRIGTLGQGPGQFDGIVGIALDDQHVYVASQEGVAVHVFTRQGKFLRAWGHHDAGLHNVSLPAGIAVDAKGRVILLDTLRQELKYFDPDGKLIDLFGGLGRHPGAVSYPGDLSMDGAGRLCVADGGNRRAQVLVPIDATPLDADPASPDSPGAN